MYLGDPSSGRAPVARWAIACLAGAALLLAPSCQGDDDGGNGGSDLAISMSLTPPAGGMDLVFFEEAAGSGDLLLVDVVARDVTSEFDGYDVELTFDPLVAAIFSFAQGTLLEDCALQQAVKADNAAGNANTTGNLLFSASLTGPMPPGCTVAGDAMLARITFRAAGGGMFPLEFVPYNQDPNSPSGTRLSRTMPPVPAVTLTLDDGGATITVD